MFGKLNEEESREFVDNNIYGRIGCHAFGKTYVVPISYAHKGGKLYCHTGEGEKMKMMRENPSVCFEVDVLDDMANWKSVIMQGEFKELEGEERNEGLRVLLERKVPQVVSETVKIGAGWPFAPDDVSEIKGIVFSIDIKEMTGRFERSNPVSK